jgi:hypothetical protein
LIAGQSRERLRHLAAILVVANNLVNTNCYHLILEAHIANLAPAAGMAAGWFSRALAGSETRVRVFAISQSAAMKMNGSWALK